MSCANTNIFRTTSSSQLAPPLASGSVYDNLQSITVSVAIHYSSTTSICISPSQALSCQITGGDNSRRRSWRNTATASYPNLFKVVCVSDTRNKRPELPPGDILIRVGELTEN
jgi:hypothetical protein